MVDNPDTIASQVNDLDPDLNFFDQIDSSSNPCNYFSIDQFNSSMKSHEKYLKIVCFNVRSFNANFDQFLEIFEDDSYPDVSILCETWFNPSFKCDIDSYKSYHTVRPSGRGGGVSIYVKPSLNHNFKTKHLKYSPLYLSIQFITNSYKNKVSKNIYI